MKRLVAQLSQVEKEISINYGPFYLFALSLRDDLEDRWDLLISAKWITDDVKMDTIRQVANSLNRKLNKEEMIKLSRIVVLDSTNPYLLTLTNTFSGDDLEISNSFINGIYVRHIYIIKSQHPSSKVGV